MKEALKEIYQVLLTEPHTPTVCTKLERIAREALAQPAQQEPTGMLHIDRLDKWLDASLKERKAQRTWVGLTEEDRQHFDEEQLGWNDLLTAADALLKEKNT